MQKTAVIGLGNISRAHLEGIRQSEHARLAAGCDIDPSCRNKLPDGIPFYRSYTEMIARESPDAVHICLPHHLHYPVARDAARMGCHIFAEKPLAQDIRTAAQYLTIQNDYPVTIGICLQNRFNPTSETLYEILRQETYGAIRHIYANMTWCRPKSYYEQKPWRGTMAEAGGGCLINQALHTLDLVQYFARSPVRSVKGSMAQVLDYGIEVEDTVNARLSFDNGIRAFLTATVAAFEDREVEITVQCQHAELSIRNRRLLLMENGNPTVLADDGTGYQGKKCYGNGHARLIDAFYNDLENGTSTIPSPEDAMISMRLTDAIRQSSDTAKTIHF